MESSLTIALIGAVAVVLAAILGHTLGPIIVRWWKARSIRPRHWGVDIDTDGLFVGREDELARLSSLLANPDSKRVVITGGMGVGKTHLAVRCARREWGKRRYPNGVVLVEALEGLENGFKKLSSERQAWLLEMRAHDDGLLILDDFHSEEDLNQPVFGGYRPLAFQCRILITNWGDMVPGSFRSFPLDILSDKAALELLLRHRPEILADPQCAQYGHAKVFCKMAANLPFLLAMAAAYSRKEKKDPEDLVKEWRENARPGFTGIHVEHLDTLHKPDVFGALEMPWKSLSEDAQLLLRLAGQLHNIALPITRLRRLAPMSDDRFNRALVQLCEEYSLVQRRKENFFLHMHVHLFAKDKTKQADPSEVVVAARHLVEGYDRNVALLADECVARGPVAVQEDLDAAGDLLGKPTDPMPIQAEVEDRRELLVSFIQHERSKLGDQLARRPNAQVFVLQQLHNWAVDIGEQDLASRALEALRGKGVFVRLRRRWPRQSRELVGQPQNAHRRSVNSVAITHDGLQFVSGSSDRELKVWDLKNRTETRALTGHTWAVWALSLSADGRLAASASDDRTVRVWELGTGRLIHTLQDKIDHGWVNAVALAPDGKYVFSGADDGTISIWDIVTGQQIQTIERDRCHNGWVLSLAAHNGRFVSGAQDGAVKVWEFEPASGRVKGDAKYTLKGHDGWVRGIALTPDCRHAVSGSHDCSLKVWDLTTGKEIRSLKGHSASVRGVAVVPTPKGTLVVSGSDDETLKVWDFATGALLRTLSGHRNLVRSVAATMESGRVFAVSASYDRTLCVWDLTAVPGSAAEEPVEVTAVGFTSDGKALAKYSDGTNVSASLENGAIEPLLQQTNTHAPGGLQSSSISLTASKDGSFKVTGPRSGKKSVVLKGHSAPVTAIAVAPNGEHLVSVSQDHTLRLWNLKTDHELALMVMGSPLTSAAFAEDGKTVLAGDKLGNIYWLQVEGL